ncbi:MAG: hypothetical protein A2534_04525 [Candidatus Magasanikbacteria bacterium RIFOXYD2_FULL_39_9]|uniref:Fido domain-containing protein n=1 Tax=Candidatus Magasanikbacteria bacterium RIFOXYD1_FULL_40_23 TaxID=1798705 RepID=A0A1F6PAX7_9BACT|nr:MAG: hypothetical protein A2534_04525 [Candidatus Magasanikbacteria bacterium RIFOXYD2_FULL_39_9]OGH93337.1 MAG: hypothetical protein A2563_01880 [Candidatus Magasanikbacteria bacterium RIFOXYD1_FULL_40_23]
MAKKFFYLDIKLMEKMCHPLAVAIFNDSNDPIPSFQMHATQLLESSLGMPKQTYGGKDLYETAVDKAVILYFSLIKNHPFQNGNKRVATTSLLVFLWINDFWLKVSDEELAKWAIDVAEFKDTPAFSREELFLKLKLWISEHLESSPKEENRLMAWIRKKLGK